MTTTQIDQTAPSATGALPPGIRTQPANAEIVANEGQALLAKDRQIDYWVNIISTALGNSAGWLILTGQRLIQAKNALEHGKWMQMFEPGKLKFGLRTAEMLMKIAQHPGLRNSQVFTNLPPSCSALYELTYAGPEVIAQGITAGRIHPLMTAAQAKAFVRGLPAKDGQQTTVGTSCNLDKRLKSLNRLVLKAANNRTLADRQQLAELLIKLAQRILSDPAPLDDPSQKPAVFRTL